MDRLLGTLSILLATCFYTRGEVEVRLVDGLYPGTGYVQTIWPNTSSWTTVCSIDWDIRDANVICKQLGFAYAIETKAQGSLESDLGDVVVNNVYCTGEEENFGECTLENIDSNCWLPSPAALTCAEYYEAEGIRLPICGRHHCAHPLATDPHSSPRDQCKCDCECLTIGDCCPDFDAEDYCLSDDPADHIVNNISIDHYQCVGVPGSVEDNYGYVMVAKCPKSWTDINTILNCEIERDLSDIANLIPVFDSNNAVYKNIHCALCHGKSIDDVTFWEVEFEINQFSGTADYDAELGLLEPFGELLGYVVQWPDSQRPRTCPYNIIETCPDDYDDANVVSACSSYYAPVYLNEMNYIEYSTPYRNPHCALCNGMPRELFTFYCYGNCPADKCSPDSPTIPCVGAGLCTGGSHFLTVEALFNYKDLLNDAYGNSCPNDDEVYDPFLKQCRSISCPPDFVLVDGACKALNPPDPKVTETRIKGTTASKNALQCFLLNTIEGDISEIGVVQIETTEQRHEVTTCIAEDIGCSMSQSSTVTLAFLFQDKNDMSDFMESTDTALENYRNESSMCGVTSMTAYMRYSNRFAVPSTCSQQNTSGLFNTSEKYNVLTYARYEFNATLGNYSSPVRSHSCLINTELNCTLTVSLSQSDFTMMMSSDDSIYVMASNVTIPRDEYLLLTDGTVLICSLSSRNMPSPSRVTRTILDVTAAVCGWLSVAALVATFITYLMFAALRNSGGKAVMNLVAALFLGYVGLLLAGYFLINDTLCTVWAIMTHFFWIAAFTWMMLFAVNIAVTFSRRGVAARGSSEKSFRKYFLIGWIIPVIVIAVCVGLHFCQCLSITFRYGSPEDNVCFLSRSMAVLYAFVAPISVLLFLSIMFFIIMAIHLHRQRSASKLARTTGVVEEITYEAAIYLRLSCVIGATWILAPLSILLPHNDILNHIYVILNSLQGVFIFVAFGCTSRVRKMWTKKFHELATRTKSTGTSSGGGKRATPAGDKNASKEVLHMDMANKQENAHSNNVNRVHKK